MKTIRRKPEFREQDDLRLLGLSRIPRCSDCPRLEALRAYHGRRSALAAELPPVPRGCVSPHCAPLAARYAPDEKERACTGSTTVRGDRAVSADTGAASYPQHDLERVRIA